jgi:Na+-transporting NADH:ubiquinone oxidoreductase subunit NqrC
MTADYKILDCITVSEAETDGLGDACADEKFYGQFDGKTEENYTEIDAIAGATLTTDGYKKAIERAFIAVKTLNGGAK